MKKDRFTRYLEQHREGLELKVGEISLSYTIAPEKVSEMPIITEAKQIYDFIKPRWEVDICSTERFKVIYLNQSNRILGWFNISQGSATGTVVDVKLMLGIALNITTCKALITVHNHPSGNLKPSEQDKKMNNQIKEALKFIDLTLLDNLIISIESFYSFANEGLM